MLAVAACGLLLAMQLLSHPNRLTGASIALFVLGCAAAIITYRSIYWESSPRCLLLRKLWQRKEIPWKEITRVGWLGNTSGTFSISVGHRIEDYDRIYIEPSDQAGFIAALRKYASEASFELAPFE